MSPKKPAHPLCLRASQRGAVARAARLINAGGIVAFPTETVYGLGVRYEDPQARRRLARLKGRAPGRPFQVLVAGRRQALRLWGRATPLAEALARRYWPGPLTLVVRAANGRWLGVRVPDHPTARDLIRRAGGVVLATSANRSGHSPALDARQVLGNLPEGVDCVLDGGVVAIGKASSVVRVRRRGWELLREGAISRRELEALIGPSLSKQEPNP